jgi:hypothetical protein
MALLNRSLIGAAVVAILLAPLTATANPDDHNYHFDAAHLNSRDDGPVENAKITVETRHGSIDVAPHGTPLPKWARGIVQSKVNKKTQVVVITRIFAEKEGVMEQAEVVTEALPEGTKEFTIWPEELESGDYGAFGVHYVIRVPSLGAVEAKTGQGSITVTKPTGDVNAKTGLGPITVTNIRGDATLKTGQGPISLEFETGHAGRARLKSGLGPLSVDGAGWVAAKTAQGSISVEMAAMITENISLKTALGSISLTLASGTNADIEAETALGNISVDATVLSDSRTNSPFGPQRVKARMGKGGVRVECNTHQGNISVGD